MIKLIVSDLDNTLLDEEKKLPQSTKNVFTKVLESNVKVSIATGRSFLSAKYTADKIGATSFIICYNGAMIRNGEGDIILASYLEEGILRDLLSFCEQKNLYFQLYHKDEILVKKRRPDLHDDPDMLYAPCREVENFNESVQSPKMLIAAKKKEIPYILKELERFKENVFITQSEDHLIEIMPKGINKGSALVYLMKKYHIKKEEVMACGDNYNDIELLKQAGTKIAVHNAVDDLKRIADYICDNERSYGVEEAIKKYCKINSL